MQTREKRLFGNTTQYGLLYQRSIDSLEELRRLTGEKDAPEFGRDEW